MRTLVACLAIICGLSIHPSYAQSIADLSGPIIKSSANQENHTTETSIQLSDFKFQDASSGSSIFDIPRTQPAVALFSSALIPGSGQAANGKWVRAGVYFVAEVAGIVYHLDRINKAKRQEREYENFTHQNWSVLAYAKWVVNYSQINDLNNGWQALQSSIEGQNPDFSNTTKDWAKVNINLLHQVENETPFIFEGGSRKSNFSHELPKYGSQQFYELISKYYQFQPGWQDWYNGITTAPNQNIDMYQYMWNGKDQPNGLFYTGRDRAEVFNDNYRAAGNILKLLLVNHIVSAFDAYFTVKLKNSRIEADANLLKMEQFSVRWHF